MTRTTHVPYGREWRSQAACLGTDPELFFPAAETGPVHDAQVAAAKAVCGRCPVVAACLAEALARIPYGVAGGLTEDERRTLRRRDRQTVPAVARAVTAAQKAGTVEDGGQTAWSTLPGSGSRSTGKTGLTPGRVRRVVENTEFTAFGSRILRAAGRRVAAGDVDALPALAALSAEVDAAITTAVVGLRAAGYSWGEIAARLGVTRQAAHQRWSSTPDRAGSAVPSTGRGVA